MRVRILGSAAGGGFPQWNCGCARCAGCRTGAIAARSRTETSVAVSADGDRWLLLSASPEVHAHIASFAPLWPRAARHSPIAAIFLPNGDLDACLGLFRLRESHPLCVLATDVVRDGLVETNALMRTLRRAPDQIVWRSLVPERVVPVRDASDAAIGLTIEAVRAPGKPPVHLVGLREPSPDDNVGVLVRDPRRGTTLAYFPSAARATPELERAVRAADCVLFDGTFWSSDELASVRAGTARAEDMAHWPLGGEAGSLAWLASLPAPRKILIHVNNTNPILDERSAERSRVRDAGVEVGEDGMEVAL